MELQVADPLRDWGDQAVASTCGYRFVSERDRRDIQTQRQAIWDLLKSLGSHLLKDGVSSHTRGIDCVIEDLLKTLTCHLLMDIVIMIQ